MATGVLKPPSAIFRRFVQDAVRSPEVNRLAIRILQESNAPQHNPTAEAKAIFNWVRKNFRFVSESEETLRPIEEILRVRAGDCDDINGILLPSLLMSVGIPVRLVTVAVEPDAPKSFSHIYAEALLDGEWVAVDAARPGASFGRAPEHYFRKRIWKISGDRLTRTWRDCRAIAAWDLISALLPTWYKPEPAAPRRSWPRAKRAFRLCQCLTD